MKSHAERIAVLAKNITGEIVRECVLILVEIPSMDFLLCNFYYIIRVLYSGITWLNQTIKDIEMLS